MNKMDRSTPKSKLSSSYSSTLSGQQPGALRDTPGRNTIESVRDRLTSAAQTLRFDALLEAVQHMGPEVQIQEYRDYATATSGKQFAAVKPLSDGSFVVGLSIDPSEDRRLEPCLGQWGSSRLVSQFRVSSHDAIQGWQLRQLRMSYREASGKR